MFRRRHVFCVHLLTILISASALAQSPPPAKLDTLAGLPGRWLGESPNGPMEAVFSPMRFGKMVGHITYWNDAGYRLIELVSYEERDGSLVYKVKHFSPDLAGREEKDVSVERRLIGIEGKKLVFENMAVLLQADDLSITLHLVGQDGSASDLELAYRRSR